MSRRVVFVDDHPSFRAAARSLLEDDGYEVVGEAGDGAGALACVRTLAPEVVLLDVNLPDVDGIEVARRITAAGRAPAVVLVSSRDHSEYDGLIGASGARGFIGKGELSGERLEGLLG
jgi:DNA-binding NarL/FixJ family response regulator